MKTNLEYIRAFLGEKGDSEPLFSDAEITDVMNGHLIHQIDLALARKLSRSGVDYKVVDDTGLLRIKLKRLATAPDGFVEFYAGVGNWQDNAGNVYLNDLFHYLRPTESIDYLHGILRLSAPLPPSPKVEVEVYLLDIKGVLIELLEILRSSRAKLAIKAGLAGVEVDLSQVQAQIEKEIQALMGSYELEIIPWEDYPH